MPNAHTFIPTLHLFDKLTTHRPWLCGNQDSRCIRYHIISDNIDIDTWECWVVTLLAERPERNTRLIATPTFLSRFVPLLPSHSSLVTLLNFLLPSIPSDSFSIIIPPLLKSLQYIPTRNQFRYRVPERWRLHRSRDVSSRDLKRYRSSHHLNSWETVWWRTIWWCTDDSVLWRVSSEPIGQI